MKAYLIYGEDEWLTKRWFNHKIKELLDDPKDMMNHIIFESKELKATEIIESAETMPFFAPYKVITVKNSNFFKSGKKDEVEKLVKWLKSPPDYSILIFIEGEIDKRNSLYKFFNKQFEVIPCTFPEEKELYKILNDYLVSRGATMNSSALHYFVRHMPQNMEYITNELDKLCSYAAEIPITSQMIDEICAFSLEQRVFELLKELGNKKLENALKIYHKLIEAKESPLMILVMIARQFRLLLQVKYLIKQSQSAKQIGSKLKLPYFVVEDLIKQSHKYSFIQLESILEMCLVQDQYIKTGQIDPVYSIEYLMIECACML